MIKKIDQLSLDFDGIFSWIEDNPSEEKNDVYDPNMPFDAEFRTDWEKTTKQYYTYDMTTFNVWRPEIKQWIDDDFFVRHGLDPNKAWCRIACTGPAKFLPPHIDICPGAPASGFTASRQEILDYNEGAVRYWIPLKNAERGQIFYGEGWAINSWSRGDVYAWDTHEEHGFVNAGLTDRWVLLLSAYKI